LLSATCGRGGHLLDDNDEDEDGGNEDDGNEDGDDENDGTLNVDVVAVVLDARPHITINFPTSVSAFPPGRPAGIDDVRHTCRFIYGNPDPTHPFVSGGTVERPEGCAGYL